MLILSRKEGQTINMYFEDKKIEIVCVDIAGAQTKIGFKAPPDVVVVRSEIDSEESRRNLINKNA